MGKRTTIFFTDNDADGRFLFSEAIKLGYPWLEIVEAEIGSSF
ncbi:hypothetical protein J2Y45_006037 [Dyadobacter sp. BE34]|uniref:Uncharacterized protein n=1 Tax=Dyadobacter fermentans TaxID=94254 RepID=A0ABU1R8A0_9BACT|nr:MULTISPECIES: hypothetical protein [Dyadobacter]MDR7218842.1 hypothetical protein [Dyadobacter sp. BE31]MDR6808825.1 hypothetical protein [Dyadobacter fermentans]MDR7046568.1 hypothetical protein [Dyadobacter sp. BE242]MDR7200881.1 hypothetical protein [Dyadobacter sp. BE34]MDR7266771.1 hypothetical protein [Dyadobacter sp. BE32]